jgi:hypothetical protein
MHKTMTSSAAGGHPPRAAKDEQTAVESVYQAIDGCVTYL